MKSLIFIHSYDVTTEFLEEIIFFLSGKGFINYNYIKLFEVERNAEEVREIVEKTGQGSTIFFLGHGASHCIYLPNTKDRPAEPFINKDNFGMLRGKNLVCLSCRSAEFIKKNFDLAGGSTMIGFNDLPTDWPDIHAEREMADPAAYAGVDDSVLAKYREMMVAIMANSLYDAIKHKLDFHRFYLRLRLYTNRLMFTTANYSISKNPTLLANMLYELKTGIELFGNPATSFL